MKCVCINYYFLDIRIIKCADDYADNKAKVIGS